MITVTYSHYINMAQKFGSVFYVLLIDFNPDQIHIEMNANNATCAYWPNFHTQTVTLAFNFHLIIWLKILVLEFSHYF